MIWQRRTTRCLSPGSQAAGTPSPTSLLIEKRITNSTQVWRTGTKLHTTPGELLHGQVLCSCGSRHPGPGKPGTQQFDGPIMAKGYIPFIGRSHLATTYCKPELQGVYPFCDGQSRTSSPVLVWKERRARASGREQRGTPKETAISIPLLSASRGTGGWQIPGSGEQGGGRGSAQSPGAMWQPPPQALWSSLARGLRVLLSCLRS